MNRIQFFVLTGLSSLVVLLLIGHIFLVRATNFEQNRLAAAQQIVTQGSGYQGNLRELAMRIAQDAQNKNDQALKDLLARNQITFSTAPAPQGAENTNPAPAPTH